MPNADSLKAANVECQLFECGTGKSRTSVVVTDKADKCTLSRTTSTVIGPGWPPAQHRPSVIPAPTPFQMLHIRDLIQQCNLIEFLKNVSACYQVICNSVTETPVCRHNWYWDTHTKVCFRTDRRNWSHGGGCNVDSWRCQVINSVVALEHGMRRFYSTDQPNWYRYFHNISSS